MVRDAATVMVLRQREHLEVFMVRRHKKMDFMANAYVYPGGKLDDADTDDEVMARVCDLSPDEAASRLGCEPDKAVGLYLAGIRESFEEAGVLFARKVGASDFFDLTNDVDTQRRFEVYREKLHHNELSLSMVAEIEDLEFPLGELAFFAHWVTPTFESKRFDARFFVARAPEKQEPLHDARETTDSLWIRPDEAVDRSREDGFFLAPPTLRTLEALDDFDSVDEVFEYCDGRTPPRILPHFEPTDESMVLLMPGDPEFPADDPTYTNTDPVDGGVTRLVLRNGIWHHG